MQCCERRQAAMENPIEFESSSSDKIYRVYLFREGRQLPMCTCFPYLTSRKKKALKLDKPINDVAGECRHIREAHRQTCTWTEADGGYQFSGLCPQCGSKTVDADSDGHVIQVSRDEAIAALLALRDKRSPSEC